MMRGFDLIKQLSESKAVIGLNMKRLWDDRGTLAPWDPPRRFVVSGPYRFVRNPMISGVVFVLLAEACIMRSRPHAEWAGLFLAINAIYIPLFEEPMLSARFGEPYARYRRAVRRFLPRSRAWDPESGSEPAPDGHGP